jgi:hypothetical protein
MGLSRRAKSIPNPPRHHPVSQWNIWVKPIIIHAAPCFRGGARKHGAHQTRDAAATLRADEKSGSPHFRARQQSAVHSSGRA